MWVYIVNYYGQLTNEWIKKFADFHSKAIIDNAQAYFVESVTRVNTIYTCCKFLGVADGGILYTDKLLNHDYPQDESFQRMRFLLGCFERTASEFYCEYVKNNDFFDNEPIKKCQS